MKEDDVTKLALDEKAKGKTDKAGVQMASWLIALGSGIFLGMVVDTWYMVAGLFEHYGWSWTVYAGIVGAVGFLMAGMVITDYFVDTKSQIYTARLAWSGIPFLAELILIYFGGKLAAILVGAIVLILAGIWLKVNKYL